MSDNTQPASSRRALREKRRAETEALLANSKAEQQAREQAAEGQKAPADSSPTQPDGKSQTAAKEPAPSKSPVAAKKPVAPAKAQSVAAQKPTAPVQKPVAAKPAAAPAKPSTKPAAAKSAPAKPEVKPTPGAQAVKPVPSETAAKPAQAEAKNVNDSAKPQEVLGERASLRRARDREALRERRRLQDEVSQLTTNVPTAAPAEEPKPLTRRQLRLQALANQQKVEDSTAGATKASIPVSGVRPSAKEDSPDTAVMSVEDALAARRHHAPAPAVDPNLLSDDDNEIDLEVLAHQREMAARAAIISRRAAERERIRQDNVKAGKEGTSPDPFTGAMGSIRELEDQVARSGVSGPPTASVSLNLDATGRVPAAKTEATASGKKSTAQAPAKPASKSAQPTAKPAPKPATKAAAKPVAKTQNTLNKKQAVTAGASPASQVAEEATFDVVDLPRVQAVQAQGLQPLDAQTAGVRRANNMFLAMIAALSVGGIALVAGIIMMVSN